MADLGNLALRVGADTANDMVSDAAASLIVTGRYEFSMENLATSLATNALTGGRKFDALQTRLAGAVRSVAPRIHIDTPDLSASHPGHSSHTGTSHGTHTGNTSTHTGSSHGTHTGNTSTHTGTGTGSHQGSSTPTSHHGSTGCHVSGQHHTDLAPRQHGFASR